MASVAKQRLLILARSLHSILSDRLDIPNNADNELSAVLQQGRIVIDNLADNEARELATLGVKLWNAVPQIDSGQLHGLRAQGFSFLVHLRVFAAHLCNIKTAAVLTFLKTAQACLKSGLPDLALSCFEQCSAINDKKDSSDEIDDTTLTYYLLRIQHAKTISNADLAELFTVKLLASHGLLSGCLQERTVELFLEYGQDTEQNHPTFARKWYERALAVLERASSERLQMLRSLLQATVTGLVQLDRSTDRPETRSRALQLIQRLLQFPSLRRWPWLVCLEIDVLLDSESTDEACLQRSAMHFRSCEITPEAFHIIRAALIKLERRDSGIAMHAAKNIIVATIDTPEGHSKSTNEALILFTAMVSKGGLGQDEQIRALRQAYDDVSGRYQDPLDPDTALCILSLLWARLKASHARDHAYQWGELCRHQLLSNCGGHNRRILARQAIDAALACGDATSASSVFDEMRSSTQMDAVDHYLGYRIAIALHDHDLAFHRLHAVAKAYDNADNAILHACCSEAQKSMNRVLVTDMFRRLVETNPTNIVLLRCLAKLLLGDVAKSSSPECLTEVEQLFTLASKTLSDSSIPRVAEEYLWWSKTAYNLGLQNLNADSQGRTNALLYACVDITTIVLQLDPLLRDMCCERITTCHYVLATTLIAGARQQPELEPYEETRQHIIAYFEHLKEHGISQIDERSHTLRRYELESIIHIQQWSDLHSAIQECLRTGTSESRWNKLADLAMIIHTELSGQTDEWAHNAPDVLQLLQRSINELWKHEKNTRNVARWLRTTFAIDQEIATDDAQHVALKLLDQAAVLARRGANGETDPYPPEELQWLASTAFNRGIDHFLSNDTSKATKFFDASLELARHASDHGALHACLTNKRALTEA